MKNIYIGKSIVPIDYFKQSSRDIGAFKTDPTLVELGPMMLAANARLAENIKAEIAHNPYPHHLNMTPRDKSGARVAYPRVPIHDHEVNKMHSKFFVSEKPEQDEEFVKKFTKHMYAQFHKKQKTLEMMGNDPFKKSKDTAHLWIIIESGDKVHF